MRNRNNAGGKPLPLVIDTMPGRKLRMTSIDRRLHAGTEGFRDSHPFSPSAGKHMKDIPY